MTTQELQQQVHLVGLVADEAVDEPDVLRRRPHVVDSLEQLAGYEHLNETFYSGNGHDPGAYISALATALAPYREAQLDDAPELVEELGRLAETLRSGLAQN